MRAPNWNGNPLILGSRPDSNAKSKVASTSRKMFDEGAESWSEAGETGTKDGVIEGRTGTEYAFRIFDATLYDSLTISTNAVESVKFVVQMWLEVSI